jgi:hypothetical protein
MVSRDTSVVKSHGVPAHDQALHMIVTSFHRILRLSSETSGEKVTSTTDVPRFERAPVAKRQPCAISNIAGRASLASNRLAGLQDTPKDDYDGEGYDFHVGR